MWSISHSVRSPRARGKSTGEVLSDRQIEIAGRRLGYSIFGDPDGAPVLYFHGVPGSRCEAAVADEDARQRGLALIALDRPGIGLSEFRPGRRILDWPPLVCAFADCLGLDRFSILGVSGGGPYALACAYEIPDRLVATAICCGVPSPAWAREAPPDSVAHRVKILLDRPRPILGAIGAALRFILSLPGGTSLLNLIRLGLPEPDRHVVDVPEFRALLNRNTREAFRGSTEGLLYDARLLMENWGFDPAEITMRLQFWHGELDSVVPVEFARTQIARIPLASAEYLPDSGHMSLVLWGKGDILDYLKAMVE